MAHLSLCWFFQSKSNSGWLYNWGRLGWLSRPLVVVESFLLIFVFVLTGWPSTKASPLDSWVTWVQIVAVALMMPWARQTAFILDGLPILVPARR